MGIFAILFPLISTYIVSRLVTRSRYWVLFIILNFVFVFLSPVLLRFFISENSQFTAILVVMMIYSVVFVPILTLIMRNRRVKYHFQGKWTAPLAFRNHKVIYISSICFYIYIYVYIWTMGFSIPSSQANILFYVFTGVLTFYYMILGFGIAKVGMEDKKRRKKAIAASGPRRMN